ncbi:hypothetical protein LEP1GSC043_3590 [Leptospira weilii str. Ecochallenge]|uniref:Uncharacterized protein n=1 Tax=Leptospira weilii str. Ecochallenge TaxID=1049986 RepID=N1U2B6_9LEPT|nr:hypothetical protein LEP1GSC043_3590 [Leptospira weilii str. Ecochallenge]
MYKVQEFFSEANEYLLNSNPVRDRIIGLRLKKISIRVGYTFF